jgi:hypothetical protein
MRLRSCAGTAHHPPDAHTDIAINGSKRGLVITLRAERFSALATRLNTGTVLLNLGRDDLPL